MSYQVPRGTQDILPQDISKWHRLEDLIRQFCYVYNFEEIRTPIFEHTNVFKRGNDSSDMVNKEMYTFKLENSSTSLTLRPEGTAGVVRSFVEHKLYGQPDLPLKTYYVGPQFRHERPQKGRMRIFNQFGVEVLGAKDPLIDVEAIALGWSFVSALGLSDLKVLINTLGDDESRNAYRAALRDHFSGSISTMCPDCQRRYEQNPLRILDCKIDHDLDIIKSAPKMSDYLNEASKEYFDAVKQGLDALGIPYEIDDRLVRGLDYYTKTIFEILNDDFTVCGGGRYDGLVEQLGGPKGISGIGFGLGAERLLLTLENNNIEIENPKATDIYIATIGDKAKTKSFGLVKSLRDNHISTDIDHLGKSLKAQFKYSDKINAKYTIVIGDDELDKDLATLKNMATSEQTTVKLSELVNELKNRL